MLELWRWERKWLLIYAAKISFIGGRKIEVTSPKSFLWTHTLFDPKIWYVHVFFYFVRMSGFLGICCSLGFYSNKIHGKTVKFANFDIRGIVHYEFVQTGQTVNHVYYLEVLKRLREKLDGNDPNFLPTTHGSCITTMHLLTRHCLWGSF